MIEIDLNNKSIKGIARAGDIKNKGLIKASIEYKVNGTDFKVLEK